MITWAITIGGTYLSTIELAVLLFTGIALLLSLRTFHRNRSNAISLPGRAFVAVVPLSIWLLLLAAFLAALNAPYSWLTDTRLTATYALAYGYDPYPTPGVGPVVISMYPPIYVLIMLPATLFSGPTAGMVAAALINLIIVIVAIVFALSRYELGAVRHTSRASTFFALLLTGYCAWAISGIWFVVTAVSPDGGAIAFALLSIALLIQSPRKPTERRLITSALFIALSLWTKQTMVPLVVAAPVCAWFLYSPRIAWRLCFWMIVTGGVLTLRIRADSIPQFPLG